MKKVFISLLLLCAFANVYAQFLSDGTQMVSGAFSFSSYTEKTKDPNSGTTTTDSKDTEISFTPMYGYFIKDDLAIGGAINFTSDKTKYKGGNDGDEETDTYFTIGPLVRYYITDDGLYGQGYFGFGSTKQKSTFNGSTSEFKASITEWRVGVGYSVKLTDSVLLDPMVSYGSSTWKDKDSDYKYLSTGHIMLQVGLTVFFAK